MNKSVRFRLMLMACLALTAVTVVIVSGRWSPRSGQETTHALYHCPMHPTYTSDHPGTCPICNMRLVKSEQSFSSICYLHNCSKLHDGTPCPMTVIAKPGERVTCPICGTHIAEAASNDVGRPRKILYWTDPMIPGYKAPGPGKSPMGMDLVPVYEEAAGSPGTSPATAATPEGYAPILLTPQKQQLAGVRTARVERRGVTKTVRAAGTIAHDPELYQAEAEYIHALQTQEQARRDGVPEAAEQAQRIIEATRIRLKHLGLNEAMIEAMSTWKEPEHGLLFAHPGEPVWMYAQVYEYELPLIRVGQPVTVQAPAIPGQAFHGTIRAIDQMVEMTTRTTRVRAQLDDPQGQLRPEMYVTALITADMGESLVVPEEAVFMTGEQPLVFVDLGQGLFEPRAVVLGPRADGVYILTGGLQEGDSVVTSGNFLIDSESRLKAALQGFERAQDQTTP